jgi:hypothetical protein
VYHPSYMAKYMMDMNNDLINGLAKYSMWINYIMWIKDRDIG